MEEIELVSFAVSLRSRVWFGRRESDQEPVQISHVTQNQEGHIPLLIWQDLRRKDAFFERISSDQFLWQSEEEDVERTFCQFGKGQVFG